jgi:hypothetical protein
MTKVVPPGDDILYRGEWLTIRAMRRISGSLPAAEWYDGLNEKGRGQFQAVAGVMETTLRSGRPPAGRAEYLPLSKQGLSELKVTKPGSSAPHLRVLFKRDGRTLWAACGFTKQKNQLTRKEIRQGDSIAAEWSEGRDAG